MCSQIHKEVTHVACIGIINLHAYTEIKLLAWALNCYLMAVIIQ
jgi:hypothetical protein